MASSLCLPFQMFIQYLWGLAVAHIGYLYWCSPTGMGFQEPRLYSMSLSFWPQFFEPKMGIGLKKIQSDFPNSEFRIRTKTI